MLLTNHLSNVNFMMADRISTGWHVHVFTSRNVQTVVYMVVLLQMVPIEVRRNKVRLDEGFCTLTLCSKMNRVRVFRVRWHDFSVRSCCRDAAELYRQSRSVPVVFLDSKAIKML